MKRVLVFSTTTGYQIRAFDEAAERLGVDLRLASDRCHILDDPWRDHAVPVRFHDVEASLSAIDASLGPGDVHGVLAVGDRPTVLAAHVAQRRGIPWHSPVAAAASRHKLTTRERLRDAGLAVPWFRALPPGVSDPRRLAPPFPCVIKPAVLSGSRGVMRADGERELVGAVERLRHILASPDVRAMRDPEADTILIESFIAGHEYAVEAVLDDGRFHLLAIFDKPDPLDGPFFEETIYVTPSQAPPHVRSDLVDQVEAACHALGLAHGPVHAECRVGAGRAHVLEVAARPIGGLCARALRFTRQDGQVIGLEELLLRHAVGFSWSEWTREAGASGVMMIPIPAGGVYRGVDGEAAALAVEGVTDLQITARPDQTLDPLPEGASYLGFIFAGGVAPCDVETALRQAHRQLRFRIDRAVPVA
jgi:ATP-grasp domain/L-amino acid ligase C-terminal domain 2